MGPDSIRIEQVGLHTLEKILPLIALYQQFYGESPDTDRNRVYFSRLAQHPDRGTQFAAFTPDGKAAGFATLYFQGSSLTATQYCVMNDLLVLPEVRGQGVGRLLIERCRQHARENGHTSLDWMTQASNQNAQKLYDRLNAVKSQWYYYSLPLDS